MLRPFHRSARGIGLLAALALALPSVALADGVRHVSKVDVSANGNEATVLVRGWHETTFSVFRLDDPQRVVIDLKNADVSPVAATGVVKGAGPVLSVTARQFNDPSTSVGRLVIAVKEGTKYDVRVAGDDLAVALHGETPAAKPLAQAAAPAPVVASVPVPEKVAVETAPPAPAPAPVAAEPAAPVAENNVLNSHEDRLPGHKQGGTRLMEVRLSGKGERAKIELHTNGPVVAYQSLELKDPGRLALDLEGFTAVSKPKKTAAGPITDLRAARREGNVRVVFQTDGAQFPVYVVKRIHDGLVVSVGGPAPKAAPAPAPMVAAAEPEQKAAPIVAAPIPAAPIAKPAVIAKAAAPAAPLAEVKSLDVSGHGRTARVILALDRKVETSEQIMTDGSRMLILRGAKLPKDLARKLDTSALEGPLASVASYEEPSDHSVRIVAVFRAVEPDVNASLTPVQVGPSFGLAWRFAGNGTRKMTLAANSNAPGGFMGEAPAYAMNAGPRAANYTGRRVDFTAKDLDIIQFLQAIGEIAHRNIVASDDVSGKISIRLRNVPWDEALDIVLRTKGLDKEEVGNVIRVAPAERLRKEQTDKISAQKDHETVEPLKVRLIPVNFAPAQGVATKVKDLLTGRGTVTVDDRTNVLIVKDIPESLTKVELLVRTLDTQTPQVLIEARIVEASTQFQRSFGIQWGGNTAASPANGNATGIQFPNTVAATGVSNDGSSSGSSSVPNWIVNMPTAVGAGNGAGIGFIFGSANGAATLNLRLTAAELNGVIKTVSAPKAVTLDNQAATIGQGVSIPYSTVSAAGANTAFVQARLELTVTPHVTSDGSVLMKISVTNNQVNTAVTGSNGQPSINTREANTNVLVKDGDTTVIGGIYTRTTSKSNNKVPFLGDIPILGALFSHDSIEDDRDEMLIFITPRIVNRQMSVDGRGGDIGLPGVPGTSPSP